MLAKYLKDVARPGQDVNPLFTHFGIRVVGISPDGAVLAMDPHPGAVQGAGVVAGGVLATLLDEAMAHAVIARLADTGVQGAATATMSVEYHHAVGPDEPLIARARVVKNGSRILFVEGEVLAGERVAARATATFTVSRNGPAKKTESA